VPNEKGQERNEKDGERVYKKQEFFRQLIEIRPTTTVIAENKNRFSMPVILTSALFSRNGKQPGSVSYSLQSGFRFLDITRNRNPHKKNEMRGFTT
jgi:hypothetical protein